MNNNFIHKINNGEAILAQYAPGESEEPATALAIPSTLGGHPVTTIAEGAFTDWGFLLEELTLPATLRTICAPWELCAVTWHMEKNHPRFFTDGIGLYEKEKDDQRLLVVRLFQAPGTYTVLPGTTTIAPNAFAGNESLTAVFLPDSVKAIAANAFEDCQSLEEISLGSGLTSIGENAFSRCIRLTTLHLPAALTHLGPLAISDTFGWSESLIGLKHISVDPANPRFHVEDDALFQREEDGSRSLVKYFGTHLTYRIPKDVHRILPAALRGTNLRTCILPASLKDVGEEAFRDCRQLETLIIEETETKLYVPRQPIYRKDEVTQLLYCAQRVRRMEEEKAEKKRFAESDLPPKWRSFARTMVSARVRSPWVDTDGAYIFDYRGYDLLFCSYLNVPDLCGMACCRLQYPVRLEEAQKETYETYIRENISEILKEIAKAEDEDLLAQLAALDFLTPAAIEEGLTLFSHAKKTKLTSLLLQHQRQQGAAAGFDFSL